MVVGGFRDLWCETSTTRGVFGKPHCSLQQACSCKQGRYAVATKNRVELEEFLGLDRGIGTLAPLMLSSQRIQFGRMVSEQSAGVGLSMACIG